MIMGFKPPKREYKLVFEDPELQGLVVKMRTSTIAEVLDLQRRSAEAKTNVDEAAALATLTADAMIEWNLEDDDDNPVPPTYDGLVAQEGHVFWAIFNAWVAAVSGVPDPLADGSTSGATAPEASIPMEPSSPSLSS